MNNQTDGATARPLAGDEALIEISSSLNFLDKQLWPSQSGWSDEMQDAIENLHFHKSQILNAVNEHAALKAVAAAAEAFTETNPPLGSIRRLRDALAALRDGKGEGE